VSKSVLKDFYREDRELDDDALSQFSSREFIEAKVETMVFDFKAAAWALQIPRRLGGQATGPQLSADKKFMRRVMHVQTTCVARWNDLLPEAVEIDWSHAGPSEKSFGAQIDTEEWMRDHLHICGVQREVVATVAIQMGLEHWGSQAVGILSLERSNLERIQGISRQAG
jgi:hypothetical protein